MRLLVTGGAGFIGSAVVRAALRDGDNSVVNVDKMTYAATPEALESVTANPGYGSRYRHVRADIRDRDAMREAFRAMAPDAVIHLAAETHVDRSIDEPTAFVETNVVGTFAVLEEARAYWSTLPAERQAAFRFVNVSTDEVFGSLGADGRFHGDSPYRPNSPYAATKAAADHLARAWFRTYGLPVVVTNSSNNYGPFQFPEKLMPVIIAKALSGEAIPIYGKGANVRDWLHVEDHAEALLLVARKGRPGANYNIGDNNEKTNIDVAEAICALLDELRPRSSPYRKLITFVEDRPGHDFRYALDPSSVREDTGWRAQRSFAQGLRETVEWYLENESWLSRVRRDTYDGQRLGLKRGTTT
jgi:dTDP-glucose 4,6-dehydratase